MLSRQWRYAFLLLMLTTFNVVAVEFHYDKLGRLHTIEDSSLSSQQGNVIVYSFDGASNVLNVTDTHLATPLAANTRVHLGSVANSVYDTICSYMVTFEHHYILWCLKYLQHSLFTYKAKLCDKAHILGKV